MLSPVGAQSQGLSEENKRPEDVSEFAEDGKRPRPPTEDVKRPRPPTEDVKGLKSPASHTLTQALTLKPVSMSRYKYTPCAPSLYCSP
jgi:hypothetical protein